MPEPRTLLTGLMLGESPRWHDGRLWFSDMGAQEARSVDLDGNSEGVPVTPPTSFTIGLGGVGDTVAKVERAPGFEVYKVKVGSPADPNLRDGRLVLADAPGLGVEPTTTTTKGTDGR